MLRNKVPKIESFLLGICLAAGSSSVIAKSINSHPPDLEDLVWLEKVENLQDLEGRVSKIIQNDSRSAYGHYLLAQLYLRQFREEPTHLKLLKQASELGQQAIELSPKKDYGYVIAAQVLDLMGYRENAIDLLTGEKEEQETPSWRMSFVIGLMEGPQSWDKNPTAKFEESLKAPSTRLNIIIPQVVNVLRRSYAGDSLVHELQHWRSRYSHREIELSLAAAYVQGEKYSEAHQIYAEIQKKDPSCQEAFIEDAVVLYSHLKQSAKAEAMLSELLSREPDVEGSLRSLAKAHLGRINLEKRNYAEARRFFLESINKGSESMEWLTFAHKSYAKQQRLEDFTKLLTQLSTKIPGSSYLYALQGEVLSENLALHDKAVDSFESAILLDPERTEFYNGLGLTYYRMARYDEALKIFLKATRVDPQDATSRYNQACVLSLMGRPQEALGSLREAIGLDPRLQQTARGDKDFVNLREMQSFRMLTEPRASASTQKP